jgi:hypothetical protein
MYVQLIQSFYLYYYQWWAKLQLLLHKVTYWTERNWTNLFALKRQSKLNTRFRTTIITSSVGIQAGSPHSNAVFSGTPKRVKCNNRPFALVLYHPEEGKSQTRQVERDTVGGTGIEEEGHSAGQGKRMGDNNSWYNIPTKAPKATADSTQTSINE